MVVKTSSDDIVPSAGRPQLDYVTGREPDATGPLRFGRARVVVRVARSELNELLRFAQHLIDESKTTLVGRIPQPELAAPARQALDALSQPLVGQLSGAISSGGRSVLELSGTDFVTVSYRSLGRSRYVAAPGVHRDRRSQPRGAARLGSDHRPGLASAGA